MKKGDKFWIVENGTKFSEVEVLSLTGNLILIRMQEGEILKATQTQVIRERRNSIRNIIQ